MRSCAADRLGARSAAGERESAKETAMAAQAGERVRESADFYCTKCNAKVHVKKGDRIPRCPQGHHEFTPPAGESGRKS
jgi:hypothetical protein